MLLRIDDMDTERFRNEFLNDIFETLQFLGIDYDEGPASVDDFKQNFTQKIRLENYYAAIEKLKLQDNLYACTCSRKDMLANFNLVDPQCCRNKKLPLGTHNSALRIKLANNVAISFNDILKGKLDVNLSSSLPDFVVRQKNKLPSYQIFSLVDDLQACITHIVRGEDLLSSTAAQVYLAKLLGEVNYKQLQFLHHPLIKTNEGNKLSKSNGDMSINTMRSNGFSAKQILYQIINMFGLKNCEAESLPALLQFIIANDDQEIGIFAKLKQ